MREDDTTLKDNHQAVSLRPFPYPYRAAMTICSDIDQTQDTDEFLEIQRFLNTKQTTSMGEGVGLEIGNSFYFYDKNNEFSFFTGDERAQQVIIDCIHAGYLDCLHSYGDRATSRKQIERSLDALTQADCLLDVWINHYGAQNDMHRKFEYFFEVCDGDDPTSPLYHADLTMAYGVQFVWVGATTRIIGQDPQRTTFWRSLATVFDPAHPLGTSRNMAMEVRKSLLGAYRNDERFGLQAQNRLMQPITLQDGQQAHEFMRHCNHYITVDYGATSPGLGYVINPRALDQLKQVEGYMVVYTHIGKNSECQQAIAEETQSSLRNLEREYREGSIYVTTTSKLLNYYRTARYLAWSVEEPTQEGQEEDAEDADNSGNSAVTRIAIDSIDDPIFGPLDPTLQRLQGITFYVPDQTPVEVIVRGEPVTSLQRNPADHTGRTSVTIPLTFLSFPY